MKKTMKDIQNTLNNLSASATNLSLVTNELELDEALKAVKIPAQVRADLAIAFEMDELAQLVKDNNIAEISSVHGIAQKRAETIVAALRGRLLTFSDKAFLKLLTSDDARYNVPEYHLIWNETKAACELKRVAVNSKRYGPAGTKMQEITGKNNVFFTVVSKIDPNEPAHIQVAKQHFLDNITHEGWKTSAGLCAPIMMGTNARMQNTVHYGLKSAVQEMRTWYYCGARMDKVTNIPKLLAYAGLTLPYTHELFNGVLKPTMEVLIPAWDHKINAKCEFVYPDGRLELRDYTTVCEFDGMCVLDVSDELIDKIIKEKNLDKKEAWTLRKQLKKLQKKFRGGTLRAPFQKGLIVTGVKFRQMLKDMGVIKIQGKPVDDIAIFGDAKVFKASIGDDGLFEKFADYCTNFESMNHRFGLLLENHGVKPTFLPSQQLNAVVGGDVEHIRKGVAQEIEHLRNVDPKYTPKNGKNMAAENAAARYGDKALATIAQEDPSAAKVWFWEEMINNGYKKERETALSGRSHGENYTGFVCKDVVAFAQWIAYCEGVRKELPTGCLGNRQVYAPMARRGKAIFSRNPVIAMYGLVEVEVVTSLGEWDKYFYGNFPYMMAPLGDISVLLRMDFDGDKARLSYDNWFIDLVDSAKKNAGSDIFVFAEWESFGEAYKDIPNDEAHAKGFASATASSALGANVSMGTKVSTHKNALDELMKLGVGIAELQRDEDYMMNKGTDVKQGADGSSAEGEVGEKWKTISDIGKKLKMTKAHAAAKQLKLKEGDTPIDPKKIDDDWGVSPADCFNMSVTKMTSDHLNFGGSVEASCDFADKIVLNRKMVIPGLCSKGHWNEETQSYVGRGLFNELCFRHNKEWKDVCDDDKTRYNFDEWKAWKKKEAWDEMTAYAVENDYECSDVYDAIVTYVFCTLARTWYSPKTSEKARAALMVEVRQMLEWMGNDILDVYQANAQKVLTVLPGAEETEEDPFN